MLKIVKDSRESAVIEAAFRTFLGYGYKRTTMDDIARAAGMSRPALYLVYKNKQDIFRACMLAMTDALRDNLSDVVKTPGTIAQRVRAVLQEGIVVPHREIGMTPHAAEMFALKSEIAPDLFKDWMGAIEAAIARALCDAADAGEINVTLSGMSAADVAAIIVDATEGIKLRMESIDELPGRLDALVQLIVAPLSKAGAADIGSR